MKKTILYVVLIFTSLTMLFPFFWMFSNSFKPDRELFDLPPRIFPRNWTLQNYLESMRSANFPRYFLNSIIVAVAIIALNLFLSSLGGYCFARLRFPGRDWLFVAILITLMIPGEVVLIPRFVIAKNIPLFGGNNIIGKGGVGLLDSYWGLIIPSAASGFGIFLLRQFFLTLPKDLEDAARIDGCTEFRIYRQIVLPLSKPALATLGVFTFQGSWNDFIWPLVIIRKDQLRTVQIGLAFFKRQFETNWGQLLAASVLVTIPVIIVFFFGQKFLKQGIALTGLKE